MQRHSQNRFPQNVETRRKHRLRRICGPSIAPRSTKRSHYACYAWWSAAGFGAAGALVLSLFACVVLGSKGCFVGAPVVVGSITLLGSVVGLPLSLAVGFGVGVFTVDVGPLWVTGFSVACGFLSFVFVMIVGLLSVTVDPPFADRVPRSQERGSVPENISIHRPCRLDGDACTSCVLADRAGNHHPDPTAFLPR